MVFTFSVYIFVSLCFFFFISVGLVPFIIVIVHNCRRRRCCCCLYVSFKKLKKTFFLYVFFIVFVQNAPRFLLCLRQKPNNPNRLEECSSFCLGSFVRQYVRAIQKSMQVIIVIIIWPKTETQKRHGL